MSRSSVTTGHSFVAELKDWILPSERLRTTREGMVYWLSWIMLALIGWYQQINLILLVCGLFAGPLVTSFFMSTAMLRRVRIARRLPVHTFAGQVLDIDYVLDNSNRISAVLALTLMDEWLPQDPVPGSMSFRPRVFFPRVGGGLKDRIRWETIAPARGRYRAQSMTLLTRFPFGLMERTSMVTDEQVLTVYPRVGQLTRRWHLVHRQSNMTRRGQKQDRSAQQLEYHGLRDYRPDDSPKWIHWRTSARINQLMVKEFEQQNEQDLAILLDPWLPRNRPTDEMKAHVEAAIEFAASLCLEQCRSARRRITLGWTGSVPDLRQGQASVRLLHEMLESLATIKPNHELSLHQLLEILPPATLREAIFVVITTRPVVLSEEANKSVRLRNAAGRGLTGRMVLLDVSKGDLEGMVEYENQSQRGSILTVPVQYGSSQSDQKPTIESSEHEAVISQEGLNKP
ncbi:MAG: hypothetical protein RJA81_594 [Planctomycetota bacterium]|jgi:uncharacterized protein (DUF58 family)